MGLLQETESGPKYLRAGFLGFQASGKTFTALKLAIGTWEAFGKKGRLAMFDTEGGSDYLKAMVLKATGQPLLVVKSQSFADLMTVARNEIKPDWVFIVDSMTHIWRELCAGHLAGVNRAREMKNLPARRSLEFQDWATLKEKFIEWTNWYLNHPSHNIICGRAGYQYDFQENEETGKKDLVKTGIKMKTEGEFGFEPSLLVEMERLQVLQPKHQMVARATIIKDRFDIINGAECDNPTFDFFKPHVDALLTGAHVEIDAEIKTDTGSDSDGDTTWSREKKTRVILCEEIQAEITSAIPGMAAADKKAKADLLKEVFGTGSWTAVESMPSEKLRPMLAALKSKLIVLKEAQTHA